MKINENLSSYVKKVVVEEMVKAQNKIFEDHIKNLKKSPKRKIKRKAKTKIKRKQFSKATKQAVLADQNGMCNMCFMPLEVYDFDHIDDDQPITSMIIAKLCAQIAMQKKHVMEDFYKT